jgi:hypothetical protein
MKKDATTPADIKFHNINNMQSQSHSAPVPPSTLKDSHQQPMILQPVIFVERGGSNQGFASGRAISVAMCFLILLIVLYLKHVGLAAMVLVPLLFQLLAGEFSFRKAPKQSPSIDFALGKSQAQTSCDTRTVMQAEALLQPSRALMLTNGPARASFGPCFQ